MAIKMVREPSLTPNIRNIDDIVPMRYAYGNQNGYVVGKGSEIGNTVVGSNFTINSGRLVLQGVECDIDANGVTLTVENVAITKYYVVYLVVNLALNTAIITSENDLTGYPTINIGDDLTVNSSGISNLPLYKFTANSGVISNVEKVISSVKYIEDSTVKNAENAIKHIDGTYTGLKDYNGILKTGDESVIKTKLVIAGDYQPFYDTNIAERTPITLLDYGIKFGDKIKICIKWTSWEGTVNPYGEDEFVVTVKDAGENTWGTRHGMTSTYYNTVITPSGFDFRTCVLNIDTKSSDHILRLGFGNPTQCEIKTDGTVNISTTSHTSDNFYSRLPHITAIYKIME